MRSFQKTCRLISEALLVTVCFCLCGCGGRTQNQPTPATIQPLETLFKIKWPTQYSNDRAAAWYYRSRGSYNTVAVAKFEVPEATFLTWRNSVTNSLQEMPRFAPVPDPQKIKRFPWWDAYSNPESNTTSYFAEVKPDSTFLGKFYVYAVKKDARYIMYIDAWVWKL